MTTDEAIERIEKCHCSGSGIGHCSDDCMFGDEYCEYAMAIEALKNQPKTTYLIRKEDGHQVYWQCANCRNYHSVASNYCSICGAKIKGWKEEEDNEHDNR